jgi:AraC family ethanolamine operon transcriptional activator
MATGLKIFHFSDVDEYALTRGSILEFTPLSGDVSGKQITLNLSGFDITLLEAFPRMTDMQLGPDCTMVGLTLGSGVPILFNGVVENGAQVAIGGSHAAYKSVERTARNFLSVVFTPEVEGRGWPITPRIFDVIETSAAARSRLEQLALLILHTEFAAADSFELNAMMASMKESLLAAVDTVVSERNEGRPNSRVAVAQFKIFQNIEDVISGNLARPIYSAELAEQTGVSVRTLHNTIQRFRGMSLHRYLRIRRLWLVRRQLLAGAVSVKATALAMGFWHLGEFSQLYKLTFGELPSETYARGRGHAKPSGGT